MYIAIMSIYTKHMYTTCVLMHIHTTYVPMHMHINPSRDQSSNISEKYVCMYICVSSRHRMAMCHSNVRRY
jgi:hypothetical protein